MNAGWAKEPMRIGIACYPTAGGSGVLATELGMALAERGHEVHFLAYSRPSRLTGYHPRVFCHLVDVSTYPLFKYPPYDLALASKMIEVYRERKIDVFHVHYAIPHAISAFLMRQLLPGHKVGVVTTLHGTDITLVGSGNAYREVTRFGIEQSDVVIAVSEFLKEETQRIFATGKDIVVVPNFVDTARYRPREASARSPLVPDGHRAVMHVSNFRPVKRVKDTLRAFALATEEVPATLLMVGDGPEQNEAICLAQELGIGERVQFLGPLDDVSEVLPFADVLLTSSETESFGLAALEAHACGVPVVGYDVGGMKEVVRDGATGFLVRAGDIPALAGRLGTLLKDAALHDSFGRRARELAEKEFDLQRILAVHESLYQTSLGR